ncbi:MFS transporter [Planomonospora parontospora subsp. parontospora]|uniref:MFS transporter n=2 Tax=Planomonospora parontospora TaxID=58119 RepID=A0AA37BII6_9ACTN|nr:MFS transporter [Planomonospora parontospora]GGK73706.1 MFS transporter [Planomonospora parontospora]GII09669.1 MFS transporter [Planomonospora parontospora subsp. parontospora]
MPAARSLWRHRDFMLLWGGQSVSMSGTELSALALPFVAMTVLSASPLQVSLLSAVGYLPHLVASLPVGAWLERRRRRVLMVWCNLCQAVVLGSVPLAAAAGVLSFTQLCVVALAAALLAVVFDTAYQSYLPTLLRGDQLVEGHGKLGVSMSFATVAGQGGAGALITLIGAARAVAVDAISYLVSAVSLMLIRTPEPPPPPRPAGSRLRTDMAEGLRYVFGDPLMRPVVIANAFVSAAIGGVWALWIVYVHRDLNWTAAETGACMAISAAGGIAGGLLARRLADRLGLPRLMLLAVTGYALDLVPTLVAGPGTGGYLLVTVGHCLAIAVQMLYITANRSFRQLICPPGLMGRMNATSRWLALGCKPLFALLFGLLATWLGLWTALAAGALLFSVPTVVMVASPLRSLREVPVHPEHVLRS